MLKACERVRAIEHEQWDGKQKNGQFLLGIFSLLWKSFVHTLWMKRNCLQVKGGVRIKKEGKL